MSLSFADSLKKSSTNNTEQDVFDPLEDEGYIDSLINDLKEYGLCNSSMPLLVLVIYCLIDLHSFDLYNILLL